MCCKAYVPAPGETCVCVSMASCKLLEQVGSQHCLLEQERSSNPSHGAGEECDPKPATRGPASVRRARAPHCTGRFSESVEISLTVISEHLCGYSQTCQVFLNKYSTNITELFGQDSSTPHFSCGKGSAKKAEGWGEAYGRHSAVVCASHSRADCGDLHFLEEGLPARKQERFI